MICEENYLLLTRLWAKGQTKLKKIFFFFIPKTTVLARELDSKVAKASLRGLSRELEGPSLALWYLPVITWPLSTIPSGWFCWPYLTPGSWARHPDILIILASWHPDHPGIPGLLPETPCFSCVSWKCPLAEGEGDPWWALNLSRSSGSLLDCWLWTRRWSGQEMASELFPPCPEAFPGRPVRTGKEFLWGWQPSWCEGWRSCGERKHFIKQERIKGGGWLRSGWGGGRGSTHRS